MLYLLNLAAYISSKALNRSFWENFELLYYSNFKLFNWYDVKKTLQIVEYGLFMTAYLF